MEISTCEGMPAKPNPSIVNEIMTKAGVKQEDILYVGDSNVDMQTAHHAGVTAIGVAWGFRPRTELEALHPAHIIEKAEETTSTSPFMIILIKYIIHQAP